MAETIDSICLGNPQGQFASWDEEHNCLSLPQGSLHIYGYQGEIKLSSLSSCKSAF